MMLPRDIFKGKLVRLTAEDPEIASKMLSSSARDTEYTRLLDTDPARLWSPKKIQAWMESDFDKPPQDGYYFIIRSLAEDCMIGFTGLFGISPSHGDAWVGIGLWDRAYWGKGYGTDAMRVVLRYTFDELNLRRVTLGVFAYNDRAIKSYEKAGFKVEGRLRQYIAREGQRNDIFIMGVLREEANYGS